VEYTLEGAGDAETLAVIQENADTEESRARSESIWRTVLGTLKDIVEKSIRKAARLAGYLQ